MPVFLRYSLAGLTIALLGWVGFISWQQIERHQRIQAEVSRLEAEAERIRRENETFSERIGYFSSDAFREQEAKRKLGLKKVGENVVVIKPAAGATLATDTASEALSLNAEDKKMAMDVPNYRKWQALFFE